MIAFGVARAPQLVKIAWQAPGCANDYIFGPRVVVDYADYLALTDRRAVPESEQSVNLCFPVVFEVGDTRGVLLEEDLCTLLRIPWLCLHVSVAPSSAVSSA